jgi:hypothetical protein
MPSSPFKRLPMALLPGTAGVICCVGAAGVGLKRIELAE